MAIRGQEQVRRRSLFSDFCAESGEVDDICHVAGPGEPDRVWWFGFDCGHCWDVIPGLEQRIYRSADRSYRTIGYVKGEVEKLAQQLAAVAQGAAA